MDLPNDHDLFILANRDVNGAFALSSKPAAYANSWTVMRDVAVGIENYDEWYLNNNTITNNGYNHTKLQFWTLEQQSWVNVARWNRTPQDDGTLQISTGLFFLGLDDDTSTRAMLHPLVDFGNSGHGFWSMILLPTVYVTRTVWVTSERSVAAKTSFLGGKVMSTFTRSVTETQYYVRRSEGLTGMTPALVTASTQAMLQKKKASNPTFKLSTITSTATVTSFETVNVSTGVVTISDTMTIRTTITTAVDTVSFSDLPTSTKRNGGNRSGCSLLALTLLCVILIAGRNLA
ncbi:hypothetical protein E2P81_ATG09017 [Venturia nashicola]|nr:hypothetical protein E2P81_ATG09017 [Venturia nashicola]